MFGHSLRSFALVAHFVRSSLAHSLRSFARALPPHDLVFRFALYNLSGGGCPLKSPIACTITFYNSLVPSLCPYCRKKAPILVHLDCPIACTITFFNSFVQSLCSKKFFHKIVKCAGTPMSYTTKEINHANAHSQYLKVRDNSLITHKSAYHLFSVLISKRGFSSLQAKKTFGNILSGNFRFLIPVIRVTQHNCTYPLHRPSYFTQHKYCHN